MGRAKPCPIELGKFRESILTNGGKHIQFNIVNKGLLLEAQQEKDKHRDLIVRVAGYSAYFVNLTKTVQDEIIARTEHSL